MQVALKLSDRLEAILVRTPLVRKKEHVIRTGRKTNQCHVVILNQADLYSSILCGS